MSTAGHYRRRSAGDAAPTGSRGRSMLPAQPEPTSRRSWLETDRGRLGAIQTDDRTETKMEIIIAGLAARAEHQLLVARAAHSWRRMEPADRGRVRGIGLLARVRAIVARSRRPLAERAGAAG